MKALSLATTIEKNRIASDVPFIVCLAIQVIDPDTTLEVETLRICNNTEPLVYAGETYSPMPFDIQIKEESKSQPTVNLNIKDYSRAIQARMQAYGGGVGFGVTVYVVNTGALDQPPEIAEYFQVVSASAGNYEANFTLGAESYLFKQAPRRKQSRDYCQWRYKDPETCGYTGLLESCDLTLSGPNGCRQHGNTIHFGAFPSVNASNVRYRG